MTAPDPARPTATADGNGRAETAGADPLVPLLDLPGVVDAVTGARDAIDRLLQHRVLRRSSSVVTAESTLRGARASAALDGVDVPLADLREDTAVTDPVVLGALRVTGELGSLVTTWERAPLQVLARLHVLAATGRAAPDELGRPSGEPGVAARLDALAGLVASGSRVPALVLAAVVHAELLVLSPFGIADGLVARAAARLTMITRGLDPKAVSVPEVGHLELADDYRAAIAAYRSGERDGVATWLRHCCAAIELGAREGLAVCEAVRRR